MKLLTLAAIFKNEAPYVLEWIAHHQLMGVEGFLIADNGSTDGTWELLQALAKAGVIETFQFTQPPGIQPQIPAYRLMAKKLQGHSRWIGFIDADEFIWPTQNEVTLADMIRSFDRTGEVGAIALNWAVYGSSRQAAASPAPVTQRFTQRGKKSFVINHHIKSIVRADAWIDFLCAHRTQLQPAFRYVHTDGSIAHGHHPLLKDTPYPMSMSRRVCWDLFRINHYVIKSYQEFIQKKAPRGRAFSLPEHSVLNQAFFRGHDNNAVRQTAPARYLRALTNRIDQLKLAALSRSALDLPAHPTPTDPDSIEIPVRGIVDSLEWDDRSLRIFGWGLVWNDEALSALHISHGSGSVVVQIVERLQRPDVQQLLPSAPAATGFVAHVPLDSRADAAALTVRGVDTRGYRSEPLELGLLSRHFQQQHAQTLASPG